MRVNIIFEKTFEDLMSLRRTLTFIVVSLVVPFVAVLGFGAARGPQGGMIDFGVASLAMQTEMITGLFLILCFIWLVGIPLVLLASINGANFISKEKEDGTLALLVSKPVNRTEIILGKLAAFFVSSIILELIVLIATPLVFYSVLKLDVSTLNAVLKLIPSIFLYSIFLISVFGALATAFSVFFRSRMKTLLILVVLILFVFFGFGIVREWTTVAGLYEKYNLNYIDLNYHLGNVYVSSINSAQYKISPTIQAVLGGFTGVYESLQDSFDEDIGAMPPSLKLKSYNSSITSFLIWVIITAVIFALSIINFKKQDIF